MEQCADSPRMCHRITALGVGRPDRQYQTCCLLAVRPAPSSLNILSFGLLIGEIGLRSAFGPHRHWWGFSEAMTSSYCCCQLCISGLIDGRSCCDSSLWKCEQICLSSDEVQEWIWLDGYGSASESLHGNYSESANEQPDQMSESLDLGSVRSCLLCFGVTVPTFTMTPPA